MAAQAVKRCTLSQDALWLIFEVRAWRSNKCEKTWWISGMRCRPAAAALLPDELGQMHEETKYSCCSKGVCLNIDSSKHVSCELDCGSCFNSSPPQIGSLPISQENGETFRHATVSHEFKTALQQERMDRWRYFRFCFCIFNSESKDELWRTVQLWFINSLSFLIILFLWKVLMASCWSAVCYPRHASPRRWHSHHLPPPSTRRYRWASQVSMWGLELPKTYNRREGYSKSERLFTCLCEWLLDLQGSLETQQRSMYLFVCLCVFSFR